MATFKKVKFKNFVTLQRGFDLPKGTRTDGEYPVVASTSITGHHNEYKVKAPCVTTGRSGALGEVLYIKQDCWPLNTTLWVKDFKGNNPKFVYFKLKTLGLEKFNAGAGVPTLNRNHLDGLVLDVPDLSIQTRIASVLSAYDNLIENNEKRIKILEEMAQRLYTEWFVKFKFPGHEKVKMVESGTEYDLIPEGWDVRDIDSLLSPVKRKRKLLTNEYNKVGMFPVVDQGNQFITGYTDDEETIYDEDLIVFGDHTRCFKYCNFTFACGADGTQLLKTNNAGRMPQILLYFTVLNAGLQNYNYARHFKFLKSLKVLLPDFTTAKVFESIIKPTYEQIKKMQLVNSESAKIRDLLIPQLVMGKRGLN